MQSQEQQAEHSSDARRVAGSLADSSSSLGLALLGLAKMGLAG